MVKPVKLWCDAKGWTESLMNVVSAIESDVNKSASDSVIGERRANLSEITYMPIRFPCQYAVKENNAAFNSAALMLLM